MALTPAATFILRHIMYSHKLPLPTVLALWTAFYVLIMRRPIDLEHFSSQTAVWTNIHQLSYIDNALATEKFEPFIKSRTKHGFRRYFYSSSDDSQHYSRNRHVLIISSNNSDDIKIVQPSFRHVTSSVNAVKSDNSTKNAKAIVEMLGLQTASCIGGGCNDNAADAQKEIRTTFDNIMTQVRESDALTEQQVHDITHENGVERRPILFGDPYHIANLCVTHASIYAFGDCEKADHTQIHHRQALMSTHSLHSDDTGLSQAKMDEVMEGSGESVTVSTKKERVQRWLVNQRNAKKTLQMLAVLTVHNVSALIAWALTFANTSKSTWKKRVGEELAVWFSMPTVILGLHFEAEIGEYFEEVYAWHNRPGPLNKRSGFRMMEMFDLYFGFEVPWWNDAVDNPESKIPRTMKYLEDNFTGEEYEFRKRQIMRGLKKGRDELTKMTTKYLLQAPLIFLLLTHHEHGAPLLRAILSILHESQNVSDDEFMVPLIQDSESSDWGKYQYLDESLRPENEKIWYDLLSPHSEDVVHFWLQFSLNKECLVADLQRLSSETIPRHCKEAPLLHFKREYAILFECLHAVFGLMMSNSRLCEQIHGMMRSNLRMNTGMDQVDAQQTYASGIDYGFKTERKDMVVPAAKRLKKSIDPSKTKAQLQKLSNQLIDTVKVWTQKRGILLSEPGNGIPSLTDIRNAGRRVQDKNNLRRQLEVENERTSKLRRTQLTADAVKEKASNTELSNDRIMRLGEERLQVRIKMQEMSVLKWWKVIKEPHSTDIPCG